jgi:acylphosphatase
MPPTCRHAFVHGRVQGVAFRWHARERARALGVAGWVRNLADGRVEAWLEGDGPAVEAMLEWLARGPAAARVEGLDVRAAEPEGLAGYDVRRG